MDIKEIKADMELKNLYFTSVKFSRNPEINDGDFKINIKRKLEKKENFFQVSMPLIIQKNDFSLSLTAIGVFDFTSNIEDEAARENMLKINGSAIIFPFIRSFVAQITAQPNMTPIVLPPINVTKMIDEE
jgi:preprotein translocase subunit SecB